MGNYYNWRRHIPDSIFEECIWCDDDPELWERSVDGQLDNLFWSRL